MYIFVNVHKVCGTKRERARLCGKEGVQVRVRQQAKEEGIYYNRFGMWRKIDVGCLVLLLSWA